MLRLILRMMLWLQHYAGLLMILLIFLVVWLLLLYFMIQKPRNL